MSVNACMDWLVVSILLKSIHVLARMYDFIKNMQVKGQVQFNDSLLPLITDGSIFNYYVIW